MSQFFSQRRNRIEVKADPTRSSRVEMTPEKAENPQPVLAPRDPITEDIHCEFVDGVWSIELNPRVIDAEIDISCHPINSAIVSFTKDDKNHCEISVEGQTDVNLIELTYTKLNGVKETKLLEASYSNSRLVLLGDRSPAWDYRLWSFDLTNLDIHTENKVDQLRRLFITLYNNKVYLRSGWSDSATTRGIDCLDPDSLKVVGSWDFPSAAHATFPTYWANGLKMGVSLTCQIDNYIYWQCDWNAGTTERYMYKFDLDMMELIDKQGFTNLIYDGNQISCAITASATEIYTQVKFDTLSYQQEIFVINKDDLSITRALRPYAYFYYRTLNYHNGSLFAAGSTYIAPTLHRRIVKINPTTGAVEAFYDYGTGSGSLVQFIGYSSVGDYIFFRLGGTQLIRLNHSDLTYIDELSFTNLNSGGANSFTDGASYYFNFVAELVIDAVTNKLYVLDSREDYNASIIHEIDLVTFKILRSFGQPNESWSYYPGFILRSS